MTDNDDLLFGNKSARLNSALTLFEKTHRDLEQDLQIIKDWIKSQPHLPETPTDNVLTNMLILNKFSIEKCKENVDLYYSFRPILPELFANNNPKLPHMIMAAKTMYYVTMPNTTEEGYRVIYCRLMSSKAEEFFPYDITAHCNNLLEIRLQNDVMIGDIYIIDMLNLSFGQISKLTPIAVKKSFTILEKVFKNIIKQMHFVNVSPYVETVIGLIKQVVKLKIANRIFAHKSGEALKQYLSIDLIPKEYGGTGYSLEDLNEIWSHQLEKHQYRFEELEKLEIDESKRPAPLINDEMLGYHGNFKKLNVD